MERCETRSPEGLQALVLEVANQKCNEAGATKAAQASPTPEGTAGLAGGAGLD